MGWLSDIGNAALGVVNATTGTNLSIGSSSGGGGQSNYEKARSMALQAKAMQLGQELMKNGLKDKTGKLVTNPDAAKILAMSMLMSQKWIDSAEGKQMISQIEAQLNAGSPPTGGIVQDIINSALETGKTTVTKIIDKGAGKVVDSVFKGAIPLTVQVKDKGSSLLSDTLTETLKKFLQKNWWVLILPGGILLYILYRVFSGVKSSKSGKRFG